METEWEATFWPIQKDEIRTRLRNAGATLVYEERLMRRMHFFLPEGSPLASGWVRVRDEGDKITASVKQAGTEMEQQKEVQITVSDFDRTGELFVLLGAKRKNYQETRRELWELHGTEVTIDEWPFLEPFIEVEGPSKEIVADAAKALGFDWAEAYFCSADKLYAKKYDIEPSKINHEPRLTFDMPNPFQK